MGHNPPPTPTLPHKGGGRNKAPSPTRGEGETRLPPPQGGRELILPPPLWGRVGVGGKGKKCQISLCPVLRCLSLFAFWGLAHYAFFRMAIPALFLPKAF